MVVMAVHHHLAVWAPGRGAGGWGSVWNGYPNHGRARSRHGGACTSPRVLSSLTWCFSTLHPVAQRLRVMRDDMGGLRPTAEGATQTIRTVVPRRRPSWACPPYGMVHPGFSWSFCRGLWYLRWGGGANGASLVPDRPSVTLIDSILAPGSLSRTSLAPNTVSLPGLLAAMI